MVMRITHFGHYSIPRALSNVSTGFHMENYEHKLIELLIGRITPNHISPAEHLAVFMFESILS